MFEAKAKQYAAIAAASGASAKDQAQAAKLAGQAEARYYAQGPALFEANAKKYAALAKAAEQSSVKQSAAAKAAADAVIAESAREEAALARLSAVADRAANRAATQRGTGALLGATVPAGGSAIPASPIKAAAVEEVAIEKEINHLLIDQAELQAGLTVAKGKDRDAIRDELTTLRLVNQYKRAGLTDEEAAIRAEQKLLVIEAERAKIASRQVAQSAGQFAAGAGLGRFGGLNAATAGIVTAATAALGVAAIANAISYAKELQAVSQQLGVTTDQLQVYQRAAADVGVSNEQLRSSFGQFSSYLGRAKEGDEQAIKTFKTLGISIKDVGSAGEILPTLIERISSISDPAHRAAVESRLFGEEGRKLDSLLSGGIDKVNDLAAAMQRAGSILSPSDIQQLNQAGIVLGQVKQQLQVDIAHAVAGNADAIRDLASAFGELIRNMGGAARLLKDEGLRSLVFGHNHEDVVAASDPRTYLSQIRVPALREARQNLIDVKASTSDFPSDNPQAQAFAKSLRSDAEKRLRDEISLTRKATADVVATQSPIQPAAQDGKVGDLSGLFAPKAPKGKSADTLAREAEQRTKQFNDQLAQSQEGELRAQQAQTGDIELRAQIENDITDRALRRQLADIESERKRNVLAGADADLEAKRAKILSAQALSAAGEQKNLTEQNKQLDLAQAATERARTVLEIEGGLLDSRLALAQTARERQAIELQLLANAQAQKRNDLNGKLATLLPGDTRRVDVQRQIDALPAQEEADRQRTNIQNMGPLAEYLRSLPDSIDKIDEAYQKVAVNGLGAVEDGITSVITGTESLGDAFKKVADQIIADLIRIGVQKAVIGPLASALFGGASGAGGLSTLTSGIFGSGQFGASSIGVTGARAAGGSVVGGVPYLVGEHRPEVFIPPVSGAISPNAALRGSGSAPINLTQYISVDGRNSVTPAEFAQQIVAVANDHANQVATAAGRSAYQNGPARLQKQQTLGS